MQSATARTCADSGFWEHVERAGIHPATPSPSIRRSIFAPRIQRMVTDYTINIARSLHVRGLEEYLFIEYAGDL